MVTGTYRDLFIAIAGSAGALTGLLFVALSVAPREVRASRRHVIQQVRAAAALISFGDRDTGLSASIAVLTGHERHLAEEAEAETAEPEAPEADAPAS